MYPSHISVQLSSQYTEYRGVTNTHHTDNTLSNITHHSSKAIGMNINGKIIYKC